MNLRQFRNRRTVNMAITVSVAIHLLFVFAASRFGGLFFINIAIYSAPVLYFLAGPLLWLWHRTTLPAGVIGLSDIRKAMEEFDELPEYDPTPYFDPKKGLFVGLDLDRKNQPVYVAWRKLRKTHTQVVGTTGSGKGVATTMMLWQCALAGECVVIFDPKFPGDEFAPMVLKRLADEHQIPFYFLNLSPDLPHELKEHFPENPPQFNLFAAANQSPEISSEPGKEKALDYKLKLQQMARLNVINTLDGLDLTSVLNQNAILYIIGNYDHDQTLSLQKMLLLRLMQIIGGRDRRDKNLRKVAMMLDELKYMLSPGALQALGLVRDKGCHIFLAHQTLGDLRQCPGLDPEAVTAAVKGNTTIKLIYKVTDPDDTGKWAEQLSGNIVVLQQSTHMQQGMFHASEGQYRQIERPLLTINELEALPDLTGMFFGDKLSKRVQVGFMPAGSYPSLTPAKPFHVSKPKINPNSLTTNTPSEVTTLTTTQEQEAVSQPIGNSIQLPNVEDVL